MNQLGCQLIRVGGGRKNIAQYLRTGTEKGSNHQISDGQIQLTTPHSRRQLLISGLLQNNEDVQ